MKNAFQQKGKTQHKVRLYFPKQFSRLIRLVNTKDGSHSQQLWVWLLGLLAPLPQHINSSVYFTLCSRQKIYELTSWCYFH